ncbi:MAG: hypothetical protein ACUBOA_14920 [Candidatus Loosdrechtia sp.]|uniref:hypothetical protein n=1 Tax=Candidatus Loosdrechtia sp. TaxID=3101272 RepID=UPI003A5E1D97|nr:MAG: hypothetical protein QY305_13045 [Candidatus Jettenia sp. AMX2]
MYTQGSTLQILLTSIAFVFFLISCGSDRVHIGFRTSPDIYVEDSRTDPDKLSRELEHDLREAEKKRRQKEREAAAKTEAETQQKVQKQTIPEEERVMLPEETMPEKE